MRPTCMQTVTLLALILWALVIVPVQGFPSARQGLVKSARSHDDDLIFGSDFLSLFIGVTAPRTRSRNMYKTTEPLASKELSSSSTSDDDGIDYDDDDVDFSEALVSRDGASSQKWENDGESLSTEAESIPEKEVDFDKRIETKSSRVSSSFSALTAEQQERVVDQAGSKLITTAENPTLNSVGALTDETQISSVTGHDISSESSSIDNAEYSSTKSQNEYGTTEEISTVTGNIHEGKFYDEASSILPSFSLEQPDSPENESHKIISIRVSSSVALAQPPVPVNSSESVQDTIIKVSQNGPLLSVLSTTEYLNETQKNFHGSSISSSFTEGATSLVTEEQPAATAVQRSHFSVEEASPSSSVITSSSSGPQVSSSVSVAHHSDYSTTRTSLEAPFRSTPVSYHSRVSTATSDSTVEFYSEPQNYRRDPSSFSSAAETVQRAVVTAHSQQPQPLQYNEQQYGQGGPNYMLGPGVTMSQENGNMKFRFQGMGSYSTTTPDRDQPNSSFQQANGTKDREPQLFAGNSRIPKMYRLLNIQEHIERNYEMPERKYGSPEQNYEVDEALSVLTNGKTHGVVDSVPLPTFAPEQQVPNDPNHKVGLVVEGKNYRKYRVEERTPDGYIVGEYGVVNHHDDLLRGVRYTADGSINRSLIYDALVKFLSL